MTPPPTLTHASPSVTPSPGARSPASRLRRGVAIALVPLAALIAGTLVGLRLRFQPPTVPRYVDDAPPGGAVTPLPRDGQFVLHVTPTAPVTGAVAARGFLLRGDELRPWDPPYTVARDGSITLEGPVATLFAGVPSGRWDVAVAVGRPEVLPTAPADVLRARARLASGDGEGKGAADLASWRLVLEPVQLGPATEESDAGRGMPGP